MYRVIKTFKDKYNGRIYKEGETVEFTDARAREILKVDAFIKKVDEEQPQKTTKKAKKAKKEG